MSATMTVNTPGGIDALLSLGGNVPATNRLAASAMLVDLTIRQWSGVKNEPRITREVAAQHGSDAAMGKYQKYLLGRAALKSIQEHCTETYQEHRRRTLPWLDGGQRILSSAGYFEYTSYMRKRIDDFNDLVADFLANYTGYIRDAEARLGPALFNPSDYPSLGEIRGKFEVATRVYPLPTAGDFRAELGDAEVARVRREIEGTAQEAFRGAVQDVSGRITATVGKMCQKLAGVWQPPTTGPDFAFRVALVFDQLNVLPGNRPVVQELNVVCRGHATNPAISLRIDSAASSTRVRLPSSTRSTSASVLHSSRRIRSVISSSHVSPVMLSAGRISTSSRTFSTSESRNAPSRPPVYPASF